jgi:hypothetical protein
MKRLVCLRLMAVVIALTASAQVARAQHGGPFAPPPSPSTCCPPCCEELKKICVPECGVKKVTKYTYGCRCEDFCLPKCSCACLSGCLSKCFHKGCCEPCAPACEPCCHECECAPRTRKVLIKYTKVCEEPDYKCVPACTVAPKCCPAPCCPAPCYGGPVMAAPAAPAQPGELLPPPKAEKKQ